jgi:serine phosphatase RsbU (regulator of sigma subunit)
MSLRQRLALGFLLFSALPLAGFAIFSYTGSRAALAAAARAEAEVAARDLERRIGNASQEIEARFRALSKLPLESWTAAEAAEMPEIETALAGLGPALSFVEHLRFVPLPAPPAPPPAAEPVAPTPATAEVAAVAAVAPAPPAPPSPEESARRVQVRIEEAFARQGADPAQAAALRQELARVRVEVARSLAEARQAQIEARRAAAVQAAKDRAAVREAAAADRAAAREPAVPVPAPASGAAAKANRRTWSDGVVEFQLGDGDRVVGRLEGKLKAKELLRSVLAQTDRERGEIPFALDGEGKLYVANEEDARRLEALPAVRALRGVDGGERATKESDWVVWTREDAASGFRIGIARPLGEAVAELRAMTARNLLLGGGLIALTLLGFFPMTVGLVRDVRALERGADEIAGGNLEARVEIRRKDEIGRLGAAFNRMAAELADHREQLLAEERRRKEDEIARRLLAAENERRGRELEEARQFQLSLLPRELPQLPHLDLAVDMTTATEVGGDYYDFQTSADGGLVIAIGDATGHGAAAGTMVTAVKSLFAATAASQPPAEFLTSANAAIHRMGLVRRAMALSVARVDGRELVMSAAGMPPLLHYRAADGRVAELAPAGTPLGARADFPYTEARCTVAPGDALLLLTDGLPELPNADGEPFGYDRLRARFGELAAAGDCAAAIVAGLRQDAGEWGGAAAPGDDVTLLVLHARTAP